VADQLVSLGLTEIAQEIAAEPSLFARRAPVPVSDPGPDLPYESDVITPTASLGREITPNDLVTARTQARAGKPKSWFEIFDEMIRNGPGPQISKAKLALSSASVAFLPPAELRDEKDTSPDAKLARTIAKLAAGQFGPRMPATLDHWFEKVSHGVVGLHVLVEPRGLEGKYERIVELEKIPARRFEINSETRAWEYRPFPNEATTAPCAPFVVAGSLAVFHAGGGSMPLDMAGLNFQCVASWSFASFAHRHLARLSEIFGIPMRLVWYDETKKGQKEIAQRTGKQMGAAFWGAFPKGMEVEIKNALSGTGAGEVQEKLIRIADRTYDRVYRGHSQASNVEVGAGSRTSTEEAGQQSREIDQARAVEAAMDLVEWLIRPWVRRNWGEDAAARLCPVIEIEVKERKDGEKLAKTAETLVRAGAKTIDEEALVRACGIPFTRDPAKAMQSPATAPAGPGQPGELARVVPFPSRFAAEDDDDAPVLGADGAPAAAAEELLAPYRKIFGQALTEGLSFSEAIDRVLLRARKRPEAKGLVENLESVLVSSTCAGAEAVRKARAGEGR
jgi:hypothetical protein